MNKWNWVSALLGCLCVTSTTAKSIVIDNNDSVEIFQNREVEKDEDDFFNFLDPVISLRLGVDHIKVGKDQQAFLSPADSTPDNFVITNPWQTEFVWGGFVGVEMATPHRWWRWQTGVAYYSTRYDVEGVIEPYSDPAITDLGFNYTVRNQRIMWENKFLAELNQHFSLYFLAGVGAAINNAHDFDEYSRDPDKVATNPLYDDNTEISVSYSVGVGLEIELMEDVSASFGYQFSDLGRVKLGELQAQNASSDRLSSDSTPTQEFIFGLSYLF